MSGLFKPSLPVSLFRSLTALIGLFFLSLGIGFLSLPDLLAAVFTLQPLTVQGLGAVRGDLGGLFMGMGFFALLGAATKRWSWLMVPVVFLLFIMAGRLIGLGLEGVSRSGVAMVVLEGVLWVVLTVSLLLVARKGETAAPPLKVSEILNLKTLIAAFILAAVIGGALLSRDRIGMGLIPRIALKIMSSDPMDDLPDGLHVALCGSGSPLPDPRRASACTAVIAGKNFYVVDTGPGSERKLELMRLNPGKVKGVLLTHFHSDHIGDLGELMLKRWSGGSRETPLDVFGPSGVESVVQGFHQAYAHDSEYRILHHGSEAVPPSGAGGLARPFDFPQGKNETVITDQDGLKITAFKVDHGPVRPAVGYRFDYKGRSLVISGDTAPASSLLRQARGTDLLIHEALHPDMVERLKETAQKVGRNQTAKILGDIPSYHTSPRDAAQIAQQAGVGHLLLTHILPPLPLSDLKAAFLGEAREVYSGPITVGEDGLLFSLPAGDKKITKTWLF